jgi:hypothetical protein
MPLNHSFISRAAVREYQRSLLHDTTRSGKTFVGHQNAGEERYGVRWKDEVIVGRDPKHEEDGKRGKVFNYTEFPIATL